MVGFFKFALLISALASHVLATPIIAERAGGDPRGGGNGNGKGKGWHGGPGHPGRPPRGCQNGPRSRDCWGRYDINTNYYKQWPNTGRTREYWWTIDKKVIAPDGVAREAFTINGQSPGPAIEANWGDEIVVHVRNNLADNGTSIHWHGVRHLNNAEADGAVSIVQCPIAPGDTYTYRWKATQYGSSWYHSHFSMQYSDGLVGPIIIHGPKTADYDIDLGPILMTDWYHTPIYKVAEQSITAPPAPSNALLNGKNVYNGKGSRLELKFTPGKKHLLRLVNTGSDWAFRFSIDGHKLTVVSMDWVPIKPYETESIFLSIGQRYEVIVEADERPSNYWIRATPQKSCGPRNQNNYDVRGIIRYKNAKKRGDPESVAVASANDDVCADERIENLVPHVELQVGARQHISNYSVEFKPKPTLPTALRWHINGNVYEPNTTLPTLKRAIDNPDQIYPKRLAITEVNEKDQWAYFVIHSTLPIPHPFHMHGHDFFILDVGQGAYTQEIPPELLTLNNPPRRDVTILPGAGYLVIAFETDNPGAWLMHCHIAFHLHGGLAIQVLERKSEIPTIFRGQKKAEINRICKNWAAYDPLHGEMA